MSVEEIVRQDEWLRLWRRGAPLDDLAKLSRVKRATVVRGVQESLRRRDMLDDSDDPTPAPTFSLLTTWGASCKAKPTCADIHPRGWMPAGSELCCEACGSSGMDGHPSLMLKPADVV